MYKIISVLKVWQPLYLKCFAAYSIFPRANFFTSMSSRHFGIFFQLKDAP